MLCSALSGIELTNKLLRLVLGDAFDGQIRIALEMTRVSSHDCLPLALSHCAYPEIKRCADVYLMHRLFSIAGVSIIGTHLEHPRLNPHKLDANAIHQGKRRGLRWRGRECLRIRRQ